MLGEVLLAAAQDPEAAFTDPSFWLNAGALGAIAGLFVFGKLHSTRELDRVEEQTAKTVADLIKSHQESTATLTKHHQESIAALKEAHAQQMQRMDDHVRSLIVERDRSNAERNEAVQVMRDFTMMAGAVLNKTPMGWGNRPPPRRPELGDGE